MPTSIIIAVIASYAASAVVTALVLTGITAAIVGLAVSALVSYALNAAFAKKPDTAAQDQTMQQQLIDNLVTVRQPISNWQYIYGRTRVGGALTFIHESTTAPPAQATGGGGFHWPDRTAGGGFQVPLRAAVAEPPVAQGIQNLHLIVTLAAHACDAIEEVHFNDEVLELDDDGYETGKYAGYVRVMRSLGDEPGQPFPPLVEQSDGRWTDAHRQSGRCKIYVRLTSNIDLFPTGIPNITAVVRGKKVWDPRTLGMVWTDNASLCQADFVCDKPAGLEAVYLDEIDNAALIAGANIDDEDVELPAGGTEKRYTLNGSFLVNQSPAEVLGQMLTANSGKVRYIGGLFLVEPAAYSVPTITLTEHDLRGVPHISPRLSASDLCNGVKGLYACEANQWQSSDFPPVTNDLYLQEDLGERTWLELMMPYTKSAATAQRVGKIQLERMRQQISVEWPGKFNCYRLQAGNTVMIDFAMMGWSGKVFDVVQTTISFEEDGTLGADLVLRETAPAVYDWHAGEQTVVDPAPDTNLPDPFNVTPPTNLVMVDTPLILGDGTVIPRIMVTWTPSGYAFTTGWEVRWRILGETLWQTQAVTEPTAILQPLAVGNAYEIEVITLTPLGRSHTVLSTSSHTVIGQVVPPNAPLSLSATGGTFEIILAWTLSVGDRRDLRYTEVWASTINDRSLAARITTEPFPQLGYHHVGLAPGQQWYYWIRLADTSNNVSTFYPAGATNGISGMPSADPAALLAQLRDSIGLDELISGLATPLGVVLAPENIAQPVSALIAQVQTATEAALNLLLETDAIKDRLITEKWISDQTVELDLVNHTVTLLATANISSDVEAHLRAVDITLGAQDGSIIAHTIALDNYGGRITIAETKITQLEGEITLKASSTYVDTTIAAALSGFDPVEQAALQNANAIGLLWALVDEDAGRTLLQSSVARIATAEIKLSSFADALGAEANERVIVAVAMTDALAAIVTESTARASADLALASTLTTTQATIAGALALIATETTTRATAVSAVATDVTTLQASLAGVVASVTTEIAARVAQDAAIATTLTTVQADIAGAQASVVTEAAARVAADSAAATATNTLVARLDTGDYAAVKVQSAASVTRLGAVEASYTVKVDANGNVAGIQLIASGSAGSAFVVLADKFLITKPNGTGAPKQVLILGTINGVSELGLDGNLIVDGSIVARALAVTSLSAITANIGTMTSGRIQNAGNTNFVNWDASGAAVFLKVASGVEILANGDASFSGVVLSRNLILAQGTQSGGFAGSYPIDASMGWSLLASTTIDTGVSAEAWSVSNEAYLGQAGVSNGTVTASAYSGDFGIVAHWAVVVKGCYTRVRWSTPATVHLDIELWAQTFNQTYQLNFPAAQWTLFKVT